MERQRLRNLLLTSIAIVGIIDAADIAIHTKDVWVEDVDGGCKAVVIRTDLDSILGKYAGLTEPLPPTTDSVIWLSSLRNRRIYAHELSHAEAYCRHPLWALEYYEDPKAREDDADAGIPRYLPKSLVGDNR